MTTRHHFSSTRNDAYTIEEASRSQWASSARRLMPSRPTRHHFLQETMPAGPEGIR